MIMRCLIVAMGLACGLSGCASSSASKGASTSADKQKALKAPGEATIGDRTLCPVSKEAFTVTDASPSTTYQGKTYYFCCTGCKEEFEKNPDKALGEPGPGSNKAAGCSGCGCGAKNSCGN